MATIDRPAVIANALVYLPDSNVLSSAELTTLLEQVIVDMGEDVDTRSAEAQCKLLRVVANVNEAKARVDMYGLKREKRGKTEYEYDGNYLRNMWRDYRNDLDTKICPAFGYTPDRKPVIGIKINPGEKFTVIEQNPLLDITK